MAGVGAPLATAFVRVRPDTAGFGRELKRNVEREGAPAGQALSRALGKNVQTVDLKQFSTLAQRLRDIRTIASATIGPIQAFASKVARLAVVAGAASTAIVGGTGLAGGVLALAQALTQVAGAAPVGVAAVGALAAVNLTARTALLGVADAVGKVLEPVTAKLSRNAQRLVDQFGRLVPALRQAKNAVQDAAFAGLARDLRSLAERYLPTLVAGARGLAAVLNSTVRSAIRGLLTSTAQWNLAAVLSDARQAAAALGPQVARIPALLLSIAAAAGPAFRGLAAGAADVLRGVLDRVQAAVNSGALLAGIERGLKALQHLGQIAAAVFSAVRSAAHAASTVLNGDLLGAIAQVAGQFAAFLRSAQGQEVLRAAFSLALPVLAKLGGLLQVVGPQLAGLAPVVLKLADAFLTALRPVIPVAGELAKTLGGALASVLPAVSQVAVALGQALTGAIRILQPIIGPLAQAIASLLSPTGLLNAALTAVAPVLPILATGLGRVVSILSGAFVTVLNAIAPVLPALATAFAAVAEAVATGLAQALTQVAPMLPQVVTAFTNLLVAVTPLIPQILALLPPLLQLAATVLPPLAEILTRLAPIVIFAAGVFVKFQTALLTVSATILGPVLHALSALVGGVIAAGAAVGRWIAGVVRTVSGGLSNVVGFFRSLPGQVGSALARLGTVVAGIAARALTSFRTAVSTGARGAVQFFRELPGRIVSAVGDLGSVLFNAGKAVIQGLINGIKSAIGALGDALGSVGRFIADHKGPLDYDRRLLIPHGRAVMTGLMTGIDAGRVDLARTLAGVTGQLAGTGVPGVGGAPGAGVLGAPAVRQALDGMTLWLRDPLGAVVAGQLAAAGGRGAAR